jgi:hypothetical protein
VDDKSDISERKVNKKSKNAMAMATIKMLLRTLLAIFLSIRSPNK